MRDVYAQITRFFFKQPPMRRMMMFGVIGLFFAVTCWLLLCRPFTSYVPLYPNQILSDGEKREICNYLKMASVRFKEKRELLVPAKQAERLRGELQGSSKSDSGKGFELFDTNTWIKGEKELQVLEMRALKGQLESDLSEFESIKSASVILDLAPARQFGSNTAKTKASVILTLMPHCHVSRSQLRAMTYHLAGAVRGLEPNMVAISDTKGRLYQAIDPDQEQSFSDKNLVAMIDLEEKVSHLLETLFGLENVYLTIQGEEELSVGIVINKCICSDLNTEELSRQIQLIGKGLGLTLSPTLDLIPFEKRKSVWQETKKTGSYVGMFLYMLMVVLAAVAVFPFLRLYKKKKAEKSDTLTDVLTRVDLNTLAESLEGEEPETIALMLSYLETKKAEEILAAFSSEMQEEVLAELEKVT